MAKNTSLITSEWNGFCFLNQEANQAGAFEIGLKPFDFSNLQEQDVCILLGSFRSEELAYLEKRISCDTKLVFIGTNGCEFTAKAHQILPTTTFLEKEGTYMNIEGKIQKALKATTGPSLVRNESSILNLLTKKLSSSKKEQFSSLENAVNKRQTFFANILETKPSIVSNIPFSPYLTDFYTSDSISKLSTTMAECSNTYRASFKNFL